MGDVSRGFRKVLTGACLLSACAIALSSCGGANDKSSGGKVKNLQELNVLRNFTSYSNALTMIAYEEGFYKDYGLDIKYSGMQGSSLDFIGALISKKIEVLNDGGTAGILTMMEKGEDGSDNDKMVIIGGIMSEGAALITLPENASKWSEFTNETLAGKKIGVTRASSGDITFRTYLTDKGVDKTKYTMVELGAPPTVIEAVRKGEVDAGIVYVRFRRIAQTSGLTIVKHIDELVPAFTCCRIAVRRETIDAKRDELVAFLKGQIKAYRVYVNDKEKTIKYVTKNVEVDEALIRDELYDFGHFNIVPDPYKKRVETFYKGMTGIGYTQGTLDLEKRIDVTLYRDALEQVLAEEPNDPVFLELKRIHAEYN